MQDEKSQTGAGISPGASVPAQETNPLPEEPETAPAVNEWLADEADMPEEPVYEHEPIRLAPRNRTGRPRLVKGSMPTRAPVTSKERLLLFDMWRRSKLPAKDFGMLVGLASHTLHEWKRRFDEEGPAGLSDRPRGSPPGSRLPEVTRRSILMLKEDNPDWGCQRISDMLARGAGLGASASSVAQVLHEEGYALEDIPTRPHPDRPREFERAAPNELWQTDLFTFMLKRQNRRVHLVGFMDDHSRYIVGYGLHATASSALVIEVLRAAVASYQAPAELLTDNGTQYVTWRGKSAFARECEARGIRQIVSAPRHPQTLGKIERFWGSLWRECVGSAVFLDLEDARRRIGHYIDYYNFQRPHQGIEGLVPADRFFRAAPEVLKLLKERVAANALSLATNGIPRDPFYLTGQVGGTPFSVHAEGERVILTRGTGGREEIELVAPNRPGLEAAEPLCPQGKLAGVEGTESPDAPGTSALDGLEGGRP